MSVSHCHDGVYGLERGGAYAYAAYVSKRKRTIGGNIRRVREAANLRPVDVSRLTGLTPQRITDIEKSRYGTVQVSDLMKIAAGLQCLVDEFLVGTGEPAFDKTRAPALQVSKRRADDLLSIIELMDPERWQLVTMLPKIDDGDVSSAISVLEKYVRSAERASDIAEPNRAGDSGPDPEAGSRKRSTRRPRS